MGKIYKIQFSKLIWLFWQNNTSIQILSFAMILVEMFFQIFLTFVVTKTITTSECCPIIFQLMLLTQMIHKTRETGIGKVLIFTIRTFKITVLLYPSSNSLEKFSRAHLVCILAVILHLSKIFTAQLAELHCF